MVIHLGGGDSLEVNFIPIPFRDQFDTQLPGSVW